HAPAQPRTEERARQAFPRFSRCCPRPSRPRRSRSLRRAPLDLVSPSSSVPGLQQGLHIGFLRMAAATSHNVIVSAQSHRWNSKNSRLDRRTANVRLVSVGSCCSGNRKLGLVCASGSQSSVIDPVHLPSNGKGDHSPKKSSESSLILIRHGESMWNEKNLFTGCVDVPLTPKGVDEAIEAGKRICNIPIDVIFTSAMIRSQMTAMLAMMQHRRKKVVLSLL
uniref:phosphoglycerate mutase (2,3-diphosphoglycerate-dependent) n=2 Tax=Aegilops tauschii subsp. strangulata TaxID=200361 RepID=A0A453R5H5_AEGTS